MHNFLREPPQAPPLRIPCTPQPSDELLMFYEWLPPHQQRELEEECLSRLNSSAYCGRRKEHGHTGVSAVKARRREFEHSAGVLKLNVSLHPELLACDPLLHLNCPRDGEGQGGSGGCAEREAKGEKNAGEEDSDSMSQTATPTSTAAASYRATAPTVTLSASPQLSPGSFKPPSPYMCTGLSREPTSAADNAELGSIIEEITLRMRHDPLKSSESFRLRRVSTSVGS